MPFSVTTNGEWHHDNPVTWHPDPEEVEGWLQDNRHTPTAGFRRIMVDPRRLVSLPGKMGEHVRGGSNEVSEARIDAMASGMQQDGWQHGTPLICVDWDGQPYIYEGNHRVRAAAQIGLDAIPVDVRYLGGSEMIPGVWTPDGAPLPL